MLKKGTFEYLGFSKIDSPMVFEENMYSSSSSSARRFQDSRISDSTSRARAASNDVRKKYFQNFKFSKTVSPMVFEFILIKRKYKDYSSSASRI